MREYALSFGRALVILVKISRITGFIQFSAIFEFLRAFIRVLMKIFIHFDCMMAVLTLIRVLTSLNSDSRLLVDWESRSLCFLPVKVTFSWKSILFFRDFGRKSSPSFFIQRAGIVAIILPAKAHLSKD